MHAIYDLKDKLCKELEEYGRSDQMTAGTLDVIDKLAHTIKNLDKIIEVYESEDGYSNDSYDHGSYRRGSYNINGSYRGRKRDSMGRYSRDDGMIQELRNMMNEATDDRTRREFQNLINKMEQM